MEQQQKAGLSGFQGLGVVVVTGSVSVFCSFWGFLQAAFRVFYCLLHLEGCYPKGPKDPIIRYLGLG